MGANVIKRVSRDKKRYTRHWIVSANVNILGRDSGQMWKLLYPNRTRRVLDVLHFVLGYEYSECECTNERKNI